MAAQLAIAAGIVTLLMVARRWHIDPLSPAVLFALVWLAALFGASFAPFGIADWTLLVWLVMAAAPLCLVIGSAVAAGRTMILRRPVRLADLDDRISERTAWLLLAATLIGGIVFVVEFAGAGGVPLLSGRADELRRQLVFNPFVHLVTRLVPMSIVLALVLAPRARGRTLAVLLVAAGVGGSLLAMQGGRFEVVLVAGMVGITVAMVYRLSRRVVVGLGSLAVVLIIFVSGVFMLRLPQNPSTAFEFELLNEVVPSRGLLLGWTVPIQVGVSSGAWVMGRLVITDALGSAPGEGFYMLHGYDRFLPGRDSSAVALTVTAPLDAPTYLADPYGDFGLAGAAAFSLALGLIAGLAYRRVVRRRALFDVLLYSYVAYWLLFGIYLNVWTYFAFWIVDIALLWAGCRMVTTQAAFRLGRQRVLPDGS